MSLIKFSKSSRWRVAILKTIAHSSFRYSWIAVLPKPAAPISPIVTSDRMAKSFQSWPKASLIPVGES